MNKLTADLVVEKLAELGIEINSRLKISEVKDENN